MSGQDGGRSELGRYARAAAGGIAVFFVFLVGAPEMPLTYLFAMGMFGIAIILIVMDR